MAGGSAQGQLGAASPSPLPAADSAEGLQNYWLGAANTPALAGLAQTPQPPAVGLAEVLSAKEYAALVDLYNLTSGSRWKNQQGWLDGTAPAWHGVTVGLAASGSDGKIRNRGHVLAINLYHNNLQGFLPSSLSELTALQDLDLASNLLHGVLPASLGNLTALEKLDVTGNQLTGAIPSSFGLMGKLLTLDLTGNQLTGTIPVSISGLARLTKFAVDYNYFDLSSGSAFLQSIAVLARKPGISLSYLSQNIIVPTRNLVLAGNTDFGEVGVGASKTGILAIKNTGNSPLSVSGISCPEDFAATFTGVIAPEATRNILVTFTPALARRSGGELTIQSNATNGVVPLVLAGLGAEPVRVVQLSGNLNFGDVAVGTSSTATLTIKNSGNTPLKVTHLTCPAGYQCDYAGVIPAYGMQDVPLTFAPVSTQTYPGLVNVDCDRTGGTNSIAVSGRGVVATREIELIGNMEFDPVNSGSVGRSDLTIHNAGNAPLIVSSISYPVGFDDGGFQGTIPAHGYQDVPVTFRPDARKTYLGDLKVNGNQTGGTSTMAISGTGLLNTLPFFTGQKALTRGVYYLAFSNGNYFGYYSYLADRSYIYHFDLGYEKILDAADGQAGVYLFDFASGHFLYSSPVFPFPYLYDFTLEAVLYYYGDPADPGHYNTNGVRFFYNFSTGQIITQ